MSTANNGMEKGGMFSPLLKEEPRITLAELQRHVADSPVPKQSYRYPALAFLAAIGLGLYFWLGSGRIEKNTAVSVPSVKSTTPSFTMPPLHRQELSHTSISELSGNAVRKKLTALRVKHNEAATVHLTKDSALLDPRIFTAVCGKNVFIASTAKIDMMSRVEPAASDFTTRIVKISEGAFSN